MEDRKLNEKESLDIITQMIRNTQAKMEQNVGRPLLILGYVSVIVALGIWFAKVSTDDYRWNFLWFLVPVIGWTLVFLLGRKHNYVTTYIDRIINYVMLVFGAGIIIACCISVVFWEFPGLFISALMLGMMTTLIGLISQVRMVSITGVCGMLMSPVILFVDGHNQLVFIALIFVFLLVNPGHILNKNRNKKQA